MSPFMEIKKTENTFLKSVFCIENLPGIEAWMLVVLPLCSLLSRKCWFPFSFQMVPIFFLSGPFANKKETDFQWRFCFLFIQLITPSRRVYWSSWWCWTWGTASWFICWSSLNFFLQVGFFASLASCISKKHIVHSYSKPLPIVSFYMSLIFPLLHLMSGISWCAVYEDCLILKSFDMFVNSTWLK